MLRSLQARLLVLVLAAVAVAALATAALAWRDARHELDELLDAHLAQAAALLVVQQVDDLAEDDRESEQAPVLHRYGPRVAFQVWHEGRLVVRSSNAPLQALSEHTLGFSDREIDGRRWRVFAAPGHEPDVRVQVGELQGSRAAILRAVLGGVLTPMVLGLPLLALALWLAVRHGTAPLRRLAHQLSRRDPVAAPPVQLAHAPTEVQPVIEALNALLARIATLIEQERRFTADAAHELRTPIAAIRAQAQVALGEADEGRRRHALQSTLQGCDRAARLVEQLLTLARLDAADGAGAAAGEVELGPLVRRVTAELAPRALDRSQDLSIEAPRHGRVPADEALLEMLVRNLVDNALRYSPAGARVRVRVGGHADEPLLCVEDSGPGLDEAQRARLGERFFRADSGAAPGTDTGSGLGWSIVRRIVQALHWSVSVDRSPELGGLRVRLHGPRLQRVASVP